MILSSTNQTKSEYIRNRLSSVVRREGIIFHDSTSYLKKFADNDFIHGNKDRKHFNQSNYKLLAQFIITKMKTYFK